MLSAGQFENLVREGLYGFPLFTIKLFLLGGCRPADPRYYWGLPAPQTPWRGACSPPCPPAYREAPPLGLSVDLGTKILVPASWYQDLGTKILVPRCWYQDLGTKIYGEPERRSLSVCRGARGAAGPPPWGLGGWKPPVIARVCGAAAPQ